jgi:Chaperone of endosialidase
VRALTSATANGNTATGANALLNDNTGADNTANGFRALFNNTTGSRNIALGFNAGVNLTTGNSNIDIGAFGVAGEAGTIRIGVQGTHTRAFVAGISGSPITGTSVVVNSFGRLGTVASSQRFKDDIKPMDQASEAILALKPVTFHYKKEVDPDGIPQFGLVAEQVEKVNPDLIARDEEGKVYAVRYEAVNAMLLNEFLKEHCKNEEQQATIAELKSGMEALTAMVKEQAAQIQKVNARVGMSTQQVAENNQ